MADTEMTDVSEQPDAITISSGSSSSDSSTDVPQAQQRSKQKPARIEIDPETVDQLRTLGITHAYADNAGTDLECDDYYLHPLVKRRNWSQTQIPDREWNNLRPALALVTQFLSEKTCLFDFFVRLTHADVVRDEGSGCDFLLQHHSLRRHMFDTTKDILYQMSKITRICFATEKRPLSPGVVGMASQHGINDTEAQMFNRWGVQRSAEFLDAQEALDHNEFPSGELLIIQLSHLFRQALDNAAADADQMRRVHFTLAITIVHEICHAVWMYIRDDEFRELLPGGGEPNMRIPGIDFKPRRDSMGRWDLGFQWEQRHLVSWPFPIIHKGPPSNKDAKQTVFLPLGLITGTTPSNEEKDLLYSMEFVDKFFKQETWEEIRKTGWKAVPVPKFPAEMKFVPDEGTDVWKLVVVRHDG